MKGKTYIILLFSFLFLSPYRTSADTIRYEDYDNPISYKIEILSWDVANEILPKYSIFTVIDVETGLQFKVQRRAGNKHADVQPLTSKDTKIMREIYKGKWSWNRRAIVVQIEDQMIAASMHGMPHGAGALKNGFPGHFCIHFFGSTTHRSGQMDLSHKIMILKAGGKIDEYVNNINPYGLISVFSAGVNNHDNKVINLTLAGADEKAKVPAAIENLTYFIVKNMSVNPNIHGQEILEIPVVVEYRRGNGRKITQTINFIIRRDALIDSWYIDTESLINELRS